jgi:hypothetical protein
VPKNVLTACRTGGKRSENVGERGRAPDRESVTLDGDGAHGGRRNTFWNRGAASAPAPGSRTPCHDFEAHSGATQQQIRRERIWTAQRPRRGAPQGWGASKIREKWTALPHLQPLHPQSGRLLTPHTQGASQRRPLLSLFFGIAEWTGNQFGVTTPLSFLAISGHNVRSFNRLARNGSLRTDKIRFLATSESFLILVWRVGSEERPLTWIRLPEWTKKKSIS